MMDVSRIRQDFPIYNNAPFLVYLDSASTSLKPKSVIEKITEYYSNYSANIKRGVYKMSVRATQEFESTREIVARFINASKNEVIFTRNTTEGINLVAYSLGREIVEKGNEIVTSIMEHHSNFVPWQQLAIENGAVLKIVDINDQGELEVNEDNIETVVNKRTKILALTLTSNMLGTINNIKEIIRWAKRINPDIVTVIDAAQAAPHLKIDVKELGCDFLAFSAHKMLGPTGVGILWGRRELLENIFPFQYGGEMVERVELERTTFLPPPDKFEAGTPAIGEVGAFKEALSYLQAIGLQNIRQHEKELALYARTLLKEELKKNIHIYGSENDDRRVGVVSFTISRIHAHDITSLLDEKNICIRGGHHCTMPLHKRLGVAASLRASFYLYNNKKDVELLIEGLQKALKILTQ